MQQIQTNLYSQIDSQTQVSVVEQNSKSGDTSFLDMLNSIQQAQESEKVEEKTVSYTEKKSETQEEKVREDDSDEDSDKIAENSKSDPSLNENPLLTMESLIARLTENEEASVEENTVSVEEMPVTNKQLEYLFAKEVKSDSIEIDDEKTDWTAILENAEEFIPGNESEDVKLEKAQNLAVNDPARFLEKAEAQEFKPEVVKFDDFKVKASELKSEEKSSKTEVKFSVQDLRTSKAENNIVDAKAVTKTQTKQDLNLSYKQTADNQFQVTMDISQNIQQDITASSAQTAGANGSTFQGMLSNAIQSNASELVKAGNIILKDNNQGQINMILRPESLGNVKVSLALSDKVITGHIIVHSAEAYEAMRESLDSLKQAFAQSGFETGEFNLTFDNSQSFAQGGNNSQQQNNSFSANRTYGDFISVSQFTENDEVTAVETSDYSGINIVA